MARIQIRQGGVSPSCGDDRGSRIYLMRIEPDGSSSWEAIRATLKEAIRQQNDRQRRISPRSPLPGRKEGESNA